MNEIGIILICVACVCIVCACGGALCKIIYGHDWWLPRFLNRIMCIPSEEEEVNHHVK